MSWWDYGYQIAGMANRTTLVDNNTWNNSHIALVSSPPPPSAGALKIVALIMAPPSGRGGVPHLCHVIPRDGIKRPRVPAGGQGHVV